MAKGYNILICPLEWGLGHAGRMIPLAGKLLERHNNVFIGTGKEHQSFFRNELSGLHYIDFPGFSPVYSKYLPQYIALLLKTPLFFYHILAEHLRLKSIILKYKIDIVISDNRIGLWNRNIKTVYVTHQPVIPLPEKLKFLEWTGIRFHRFFIRKYSFCFIPDLPGEINLSGRLTHNIHLPENVRFIGILSRFSALPSSPPDSGKGFTHNTLILSGPEPQRGILREKLVRILRHTETPLVILEGKPGLSAGSVRSGNVISYNHLPSNEMKRYPDRKRAYNFKVGIYNGNGAYKSELQRPACTDPRSDRTGVSGGISFRKGMVHFNQAEKHRGGNKAHQRKNKITFRNY